MRYLRLLNEIGVFVLNFEKNIDEYKILINIEAKPKLLKMQKSFMRNAVLLKKNLQKNFQ